VELLAANGQKLRPQEWGRAAGVDPPAGPLGSVPWREMGLPGRSMGAAVEIGELPTTQVGGTRGLKRYHAPSRMINSPGAQLRLLKSAKAGNLLADGDQFCIAQTGLLFPPFPPGWSRSPGFQLNLVAVHPAVVMVLRDQSEKLLIVEVPMASSVVDQAGCHRRYRIHAVQHAESVDGRFGQSDSFGFQCGSRARQ